MAKLQAKPQGDGPEDGLKEKMIAVNRVTKVVKGGRTLSFAALTVVGDGTNYLLAVTGYRTLEARSAAAGTAGLFGGMGKGQSALLGGSLLLGGTTMQQNAGTSTASVLMAQGPDASPLAASGMRAALSGVTSRRAVAATSALTALLNVREKLNVMVRELSLGERMKMELIAALLHHYDLRNLHSLVEVFHVGQHLHFQRVHLVVPAFEFKNFVAD